MEYSESFISKIVEENDIVKTISTFVDLKPKGKYLLGLCPFHKSKISTFSVTPSKKMFFCFGCRYGGDVIKFIMKIKNISFKEAVEYLYLKQKSTDATKIDQSAEIWHDNEKVKRDIIKDKFFTSIETNGHLVNIYIYIILFFEQKYPEASISYTKNYVGIKTDRGINLCWFMTDGTKYFKFKFRKDVEKQGLQDNIISYKIDSKMAFYALIPLIEQKMREVQGMNMEGDLQANKESSLKLNDILKDESESVKIYAIGSCNPETRLGKYYALLEYRGIFKTVVSEVKDTTANRCIIYGLVEAVKLLKKPSKVFLVTSTPTGVKTVVKSGKGTNADIINKLLELLKQKNCEAEFFVVEGEGNKLNAYILSKIPKSGGTADPIHNGEGNINKNNLNCM